MNIQELIVTVLILAAILYTVFSFASLFVKKSDNSCGCSSCDAKDPIKNLKSAILNKNSAHSK